LTWIRGQARQGFAFSTWYSCASYVFASISRILFLRVLREMNCFDNPLSLSPSFTLQNFFIFFLALSSFVVYCLFHPTGISRFNHTQQKDKTMNKVLSSTTNETFFFSSDLSKEDSLINAHILETERMSLMHDNTFRQTLRGKIREQKFGLILGHLWIKKA